VGLPVLDAEEDSDLHFGTGAVVQAPPRLGLPPAPLAFLSRGYFPSLIGYQIDGLKTAEQVRMKPSHMAWVIMLALVFGLGVAYYFHLVPYYQYGVVHLRDGAMWGTGLAEGDFGEVLTAVRTPLTPDAGRIAATAWGVSPPAHWLAAAVPGSSPFHPRLRRATRYATRQFRSSRVGVQDADPATGHKLYRCHSWLLGFARPRLHRRRRWGLRRRRPRPRLRLSVWFAAWQALAYRAERCRASPAVQETTPRRPSVYWQPLGFDTPIAWLRQLARQLPQPADVEVRVLPAMPVLPNAPEAEVVLGTSARLRGRLKLGPLPQPHDLDDALAIIWKDGRLYLTGSNSRSVLFAVYAAGRAGWPPRLAGG
jgi:hypothetical protein